MHTKAFRQKWGRIITVPQPTKDVVLLRAKAEEARARAAEATDAQARSAFLTIADSYEHLASIAARAAAFSKPYGTA
jgi:hypothetical protein